MILLKQTTTTGSGLSIAQPIYHNHEISKKIKSLLTNFVVILKTPESFTNMEHLWNTNQASFAVNAYTNKKMQRRVHASFASMRFEHITCSESPPFLRERYDQHQ
jgi:hypothetical protein